MGRMQLLLQSGLLRAYTGKERIMICGYHGWHDWYISKTVRNKGVPSFEGKLADRVSFNDIDGVHKLLKSIRIKYVH